jgi:hypothetical protein
MANKARIQGRNQGERRVSTQDHREALRAGARVLADPNAQAESLEAAEELCEQTEKICDELESLRAILRTALWTFEHQGAGRGSSRELIEEALRSARDDIDMLEHAVDAPGLRFCRAQYRIDLAFAIAKHLDTFGTPMSEGELTVARAVEAEQARARGAS